ncbi:hypothetical protein SAMN05216268_1583 [Streptomyces yunnanensis]|uniref:Uncharacterized protein n=1 Tax=Streptomyces yunnanensis TaxID=156453 RepID=A0A9X8N9U7_9ACTN|nr:hypothetical protein SAMN05216268_1583 [Streptomyces yunnanensis]
MSRRHATGDTCPTTRQSLVSPGRRRSWRARSQITPCIASLLGPTVTVEVASRFAAPATRHAFVTLSDLDMLIRAPETGGSAKALGAVARTMSRHRLALDQRPRRLLQGARRRLASASPPPRLQDSRPRPPALGPRPRSHPRTIDCLTGPTLVIRVARGLDAAVCPPHDRFSVRLQWRSVRRSSTSNKYSSVSLPDSSTASSMTSSRLSTRAAASSVAPTSSMAMLTASVRSKLVGWLRLSHSSRVRSTARRCASLSCLGKLMWACCQPRPVTAMYLPGSFPCPGRSMLSLLGQLLLARRALTSRACFASERLT